MDNSHMDDIYKALATLQEFEMHEHSLATK